MAKGFTASPVSAKQTAFNASATLTSALVTAGVLGDASEALEFFNNTADEVFNDLQKLVAEETQSSPVYSSGNAQQSPGDVAFNSGKHNGKTIAQVAQSDPSYIEWLVTKSNNQFMKNKAQAYLDSVQAGV